METRWVGAPSVFIVPDPGVQSMKKHRTACALTLLGLALVTASCRSRPNYEDRSVEELEQMLADPSPTVQAQGAYGLGLHGAEARSAVPALAKALKAESALVREYAARALGLIGPDAKVAVPELTAALKQSEWA